MSNLQVANAVSAIGSRTEEFGPGEGRYLDVYSSTEFGDAHVTDGLGRAFSHRWDAHLESGINDVATTWSYYSNSDTPPSTEETVNDILHLHGSIAPFVEHNDWPSWGMSVGLSGDAARDEFERIDGGYVQLRGMLSADDFRVAQAAADHDLFANFEHDGDEDDDVDQAAFDHDEEMFGAQHLQEPFTVRDFSTTMDADDYEAELRRAIDGIADGEDTILSDDAAMSTIARMSTFANGGRGGESGFSRVLTGEIDRDDLLDAIAELRKDPYSIDGEDFDVLEHWARNRDPEDGDRTVDQAAFEHDEEMFGAQHLQEPFSVKSFPDQMASNELDRIMDEAHASGGVPSDGAAVRALGWLGVRMDETDNGFTRAAGGEIDRIDLIESIEGLRKQGVSDSFDERDLRDLDVLERWVRTHR